MWVAATYPTLERGKAIAYHQVLVMNKVDLLPYVPFDMAKARPCALRVNPDLRLFETSCTTGQGLDPWVDWLLEARRARRA